ncbi:PTS sugar transporter subunit IIA [Pelobacter sp. M08fum]|uniref:PTS sugar transporter subunit IIA n=2 Tax=Pelovirga terrestris TaxID=2771352 RepID=A0A8J6QQY4_9BACT|nr:PTS sugar transporter subunit IIA [Pelovirga terrestris]
MKISELLNPQAIISELSATDKKEVLAELTDTLVALVPELDRNRVLEVLHEREKLGSTGIGDGVAIPHGKIAKLGELQLVFARSTKGVDFESMDGQLAQLFFLLIAPEGAVGVHLKTLARISKLLKDVNIRKQLLAAKDAAAIYQIILANETSP